MKKMQSVAMMALASVAAIVGIHDHRINMCFALLVPRPLESRLSMMGMRSVS